jgi:glycosyltransferase involved in cell wall biosynthesis/putative flippase GtrA
VGGALATIIDLGLFLALYLGADLMPLAADLLAVSVARVFSFWFHRVLTFPGDPKVRWMARPATVAGTMAIGTVVDVAVLGVLRWVIGGGVAATIIAKLAALTVAALVRLTLYRRTLFSLVRDDINTPVPRPQLVGGPRLSVVIPAYREGDRIASTLTQLRAALADVEARGGLELLVVDDGSGDDTAERARAAGADQVLEFDTNRGKGAAVRAGMMAAEGRTVAFIDADLAYSPAQLLELLDAVEDGWDVAVGSRQHTETTTLVRAGRLRELGGRAVNLLTHLVLLGQHRDTQCGIKAMRRDAARAIFSRARVDRFAFDVEMFYLVERYRFSLTELPVKVVNSGRSTVRIVPATIGLVGDLFRIRVRARQGLYDLDPADRDRLARSDRDDRVLPDSPQPPNVTVHRHG